MDIKISNAVNTGINRPNKSFPVIQTAYSFVSEQHAQTQDHKYIREYTVDLTDTKSFCEQKYIESVHLMRSLYAQIVYNDLNYEGKGNSFYHIKRVDLPRVKEQYKDLPEIKKWLPFINSAYNFLDADYGIRVARQLYKLIDKIDQIATSDKQSDTIRSREDIFLAILHEFETKAKFAEAVSLEANTNDVSDIDTVKYGEIVGRGILTGKEFMPILKAKHPINDFGAGLQHSPFSHRLQWYLFAQELTDYPQEYQISFNVGQLSDFYSVLGDAKFNSMFDFSGIKRHRIENAIPLHLNVGNLWIQIFDRYGYDGYWSVPSTFGFMKHLGFFEGLPVRAVPNNPNVCVILEKIKEHFSGDRNIAIVSHEQLKIHR
jgi:hypothetical protein